jgi:hypothetical protein
MKIVHGRYSRRSPGYAMGLCCLTVYVCTPSGDWIKLIRLFRSHAGNATACLLCMFRVC